ncbi:MAG: hypothetical protein M1828_003009 [Chrysothrix sp. TS-e1954]|nr:MAG: hypothetical protein M1828_003009 [Chrysothrix sp. TS-e1954]
MFLYQETRLNLEPASSHTTVDLELPASRSLGLASQGSPKRRRIERPSHSRDEATFASENIALEAGIHFRPSGDKTKAPQYPRNILWRILDDSTLLELQATDLAASRDESQRAALTLRFKLPNPLISRGVAFAEARDGPSDGSLVVFALTRRGELYTLSLSTQAFSDPHYLEDVQSGSAGWCRLATPSSLSYRTALRIMAKDEGEVWVSLNDGNLVRLCRPGNENNVGWRDTIYSTGGWKSSMRGLLSWKSAPSIHFRDVDYDARAAISMDVAPDGNSLWTVCLDHTIRVWDISTGKVTVEKDLAGNLERDFQKPFENLIDPSCTQALQLSPSSTDNGYNVITFSPQTRCFIFWAVSDDGASEISLENPFPNSNISIPSEKLFGNPAFSIESFHMHQSGSGKSSDSRAMWILARCAGKYHTLNIKFNPRNPVPRFGSATSWMSVQHDLSVTNNSKESLDLPIDPSKSNTITDPLSVSERWAMFLTRSGRYSMATLETALAIYQRSLSKGRRFSATSSANPHASLRERMLETVAAASSLSSHADEVDFQGYDTDIAAQWQVFYGVVQDLQKQREQVLSLAFDEEENQPWLCFADCISPLRSCNDVELLWNNRTRYAQLDLSHKQQADSPLVKMLYQSDSAASGQLFYALDVFRKSFPKRTLNTFRDALLEETIHESLSTLAPSLQSLYDRSGLDGQINDDDYSKLIDALKPFGGFDELDTDAFLRVLRLFAQPQRGHPQSREVTRYGMRLLIEGAQDTVELASDILLDLLLLLTFMVGEIDPADLPKSFDPEQCYSGIRQKIQEHEILKWLMNAPVQSLSPAETDEATNDKKRVSENSSSSPSTLFECLYLNDWRDMKIPKKDSMELLTYWCGAWCYGPRLKEQYEATVADIMAMLLQTRHFDYAVTFLKYMPNTPWSTYLRARLYLAINDFQRAAFLFRQAANDLVANFYVEQYDTAPILSEDEHRYFNDGYPKLYSHIMTLFDRMHVMSYVAEFASLALEHSLQEGEEADLRLRSTLIDRKFFASIRISDYQRAFEALLRYTDTNLRERAMAAFLDALLSSSRTTLLLSLPWSAPLAQSVDAKLEELCAHTSTSGLFSTPKTDDSAPSMQPHKVLYAFRISRGDYRGAALCLWERLQRLKLVQSQGVRGVDVDEAVAEAYLALINCLSLVDEDMAWMLVRPYDTSRNGKAKLITNGELNDDDQEAKAPRAERRVITLEDVRLEWQNEMDRVADVEAGRFALGNGDDLDGGMDLDASMGTGAGYARMPGSLGGGVPMEVDVFAA